MNEQTPNTACPILVRQVALHGWSAIAATALLLAVGSIGFAQQPAGGDAKANADQSDPAPEATPESDAGNAAEGGSNAERTNLNLLGQEDTRSGEARRNENVQFNLVDTNTLQELNIRLGATATIVTDFQPDRD